MEPKKELLGLTRKEIGDLLLSLGEPRYRGAQIFRQLHRGRSPEEMTDVGRATRAALAEVAFYALPAVRRKLVSALDGTVKYLFALSDGNCVESVLMHYEHGTTICVSSQVGCAMGCRFCASTLGGRVRNLTAGEIVGQVIAAARDSGERIGGVVLMGIGEPLDNFDAVVRFIELVTDPAGLNIGGRHISLSTCGLVDRIDRLAALRLPITLSISLHAADDETRSAIMPVNRRWPLADLLAACRRYFRATGRRISFEYTLIAGKNDSPETALRLAHLLNRSLRSRSETMPIHVNLIPVNEVAETGFRRASADAVGRFAAVLEREGIRATVRRRLGADINASCGQLRRAEAQADKQPNGTPADAASAENPADGVLETNTPTKNRPRGAVPAVDTQAKKQTDGRAEQAKKPTVGVRASGTQATKQTVGVRASGTQAKKQTAGVRAGGRTTSEKRKKPPHPAKTAGGTPRVPRMKRGDGGENNGG